MKYDQHFLMDFEIAKKIVSFLKIKENEKVLEIGPGKGILTQYLKGNITVVEIDKNLCKELKEKFPNIKIINTNILKYNNNFDKIISNVPYSICEPLINKLIKIKFKKAVLTLPINFMNEGVLNLIMPYFFEINKLMQIGRVAFYPMPRVNSKVLEIKHKELNGKEKLLRKIYIQSDKKLKNTLKQDLDLEFLEKRIYQMNFNEWQELVNALGL